MPRSKTVTTQIPVPVYSTCTLSSTRLAPGRISRTHTQQTTIKQNDKSGHVQFLLAYIARRCRPELSAYDYDMQLNNWSKRNATIFQQDRYKYFLLKLNYFSNYQYSDNPSALMMEGTNAMVDRYNLIASKLSVIFFIYSLQSSHVLK